MLITGPISLERLEAENIKENTICIYVKMTVPTPFLCFCFVKKIDASGVELGLLGKETIYLSTFESTTRSGTPAPQKIEALIPCQHNFPGLEILYDHHVPYLSMDPYLDSYLNNIPVTIPPMWL